MKNYSKTTEQAKESETDSRLIDNQKSGSNPAMKFIWHCLHLKINKSRDQRESCIFTASTHKIKRKHPGPLFNSLILCIKEGGIFFLAHLFKNLHFFQHKKNDSPAFNFV